MARALADTPAYERSRHRRKKVERLFAHLKRILRLGRLRLRGPSGALDEFLLAATPQNLRKLTKLRPMAVQAATGLVFNPTYHSVIRTGAERAQIAD